MNILVENSVPLTLDSQADRFHTSSSHPSRGAGTVVPCTSSEYTSGVPASRPRSPPTTTSPKAPSTETSASLNIVSRLQQLHGLTKKKLYGSANYPPRTPFFTDERPDPGSYRVPAQPLIPLDVEEYINHNYPLSNSGGKAQTKAKEGRKIRLMQRNAMGSQPVRREKTLSSNRVLPDAQPSSSLSSPLDVGHSTTVHMIDPLAAPYNLATAFGPSVHLPATTHGPCRTSEDTTTATIAQCSWSTWEQTVSQDSHHPQSPCQWGSYLGSVNSHAQESWHPEGDDNTKDTRPYLAPPYLSLDLSDTSVNFGKSSTTLQENRLNRSMIDVNMASAAMNEGASPPLTGEEVVAPQLSEGFSYGPISRLASNPLPQFHHTSSSSLSAMINPRLDTRRSPPEERTGESRFSNA